MSLIAGLLGKSIAAAFGVAVLLLAAQLALFLPLTIIYEVWKRRALRRFSAAPFRGRVSVIVPAFNEEKTLAACVESILASNYHDIEIIVVNDGSTDGTEQSIRTLIDSGQVRYLCQSNAGKATALNRGAATASGDIILYTDADSLFLPDTIGQMVRWFADPSIHAVCGNDTPLSARTPLQQVLTVTTHIGTGFVRRALSVLRVLPIIAGNLGAVRSETFHEIGGFHQIWGEDLEFTFRLQQHKKRIIFDPDPVVRAECPATLSALWRQRLRWVRSYLKISSMHRNLFRPASAFPFSLYLPINFFTQIVVPFLQLLSVPLLVRLAWSGGHFSQLGWNLVFYLGLLTFLTTALYSIALDRDFRTLRYVPISVLLIAPLSFFYNFVVAFSVWKELQHAPERWDKIERLVPARIGSGRVMGLTVFGILFIALVGTAHWPLLFSRSALQVGVTRQIAPADSGRDRDIAIATHFDAWEDWHNAISSVLQNPLAGRLHTVALSAGRVEWSHFRWTGHEAQWSAQQKRTSSDMLTEAATAFGKRGFRTVAMVDFFAPALIKKDPSLAAMRFDGVRSTDQVCFDDLVEGAYGRQIIEMVSYIAHNYPVDAIALTEVGYSSFCFEDRCLASYHKATGRTGWPTVHAGTLADRNDPSVWEWRSAKMEAFLAQVADAAHKGGKLLIVDVPVSWDDFRRQGKDHGLDYARVLRHADQIVVWNYFGLEDKTPDVSEKLAGDLLRTFPSERISISVGLWNSRGGTMAPQTFEEALTSSLKGGAGNIWITPNELMSPAHWEALGNALGKPSVELTRRN